MTLKTKVLCGLAALILITLATWRPWSSTENPQDLADDSLAQRSTSLEEAVQAGQGEVVTLKRTPLGPDPSHTSVDIDSPFVILVRDAFTLDPEANAEVFVLDHESEFNMAVLKTVEEDQLDLEEKLERFGVKYTSDSAGQVRVPLPEGQMEICARSGGKFAYYKQYLNPKEEITFAELLLRPAASQRVVVVDERGIPVQGAFVGMSLNNTAPQLLSPEVRETNQQGVVEFRHLEVPLAQSRSKRCTFGLRIPCAEPQFAVVDLASIGKEDLRFIVPATGEVEVLCHYANGDPLKDGKAVYLQLDSETPFLYLDESVGRQIAWIKDGVASFKQVGIHTKLFAYTNGGDSLPQVVGQGPSRSGEVVRLEIVVPSETRNLPIRALGENRDPFAKTDLQVRVDYFDHRRQWQRTGGMETSDQDGWISLSIRELIKEDVRQARLLLSTGRRNRIIGQVSFALLDFGLSSNPENQQPVETTLGETLIVAGTVLNSEGEPAVGQRLRLRIDDPRGTGSPSGTEIGSLDLSTDQNGKFRFLGSVRDRQYSFTLFLNWDSPVPFTPGQDDFGLPPEKWTHELV